MMETTLIYQIRDLTNSKSGVKGTIFEVWDNVQKLNTEFELNPHCADSNTITLLDHTADEFADFIKSSFHLSDEQSKSLGELSLKIVKLCMIIQRKIHYFLQRRDNSYSLN